MKEVAFFTFKNNKYALFPIIIFFTFQSISPSIFNAQKPNIYQKIANVVRNLQKLNRFTLADLERELRPRKPVHFFNRHPL